MKSPLTNNYLGSGHFSIQLVELETAFLLVRQWNQNLGQNTPLGIYNLNHITIEEKQIILSTNELSTLKKIKSARKKVKSLNSIILDGIDFILIVSGQEIHWKTSEQITVTLKKLLNKMIALAKLQTKIKL